MTERNKIMHTHADVESHSEQVLKINQAIQKAVNAMPDVYSLKGNDYSQFVVRKSARDVMTENWANIGKRLGKAINKVGHEAKKTKAK